MRLEDGTVLILVTLLAKCVLSAHGRPTNRVDACTGKSIAVMDLNVFASQSGFPTCKINKVQYLTSQSAYYTIFEQRGQ